MTTLINCRREKVTANNQAEVNKYLKHGYEILLGETIAYSQRFNVIECQDKELNEKFVGKKIKYAITKKCKVEEYEIIKVCYMQYSDYIILQCISTEEQEPEPFFIKWHVKEVYKTCELV